MWESNYATVFSQCNGASLLRPYPTLTLTLTFTYHHDLLARYFIAHGAGPGDERTPRSQRPALALLVVAAEDAVLRAGRGSKRPAVRECVSCPALI